MEAQVWTLIGLLGASTLGVFATLFQVGARFDRLNDRMQSGFDRLNDKLDKRFDRLETRTRVLEEQGKNMADAIYSVAQKLDEHLRRHAV